MIIPDGYGIEFLKNTPHTYVGAYPTAYRNVENTKVIHVEQAMYRGSTFDGTFELVNQFDDFEFITQKGFKCRVKCFWFFRRPKTVWPAIIFKNDKIQTEENYTGSVVLNIHDPDFKNN